MEREYKLCLTHYDLNLFICQAVSCILNNLVIVHNKDDIWQDNSEAQKIGQKLKELTSYFEQECSSRPNLTINVI